MSESFNSDGIKLSRKDDCGIKLSRKDECVVTFNVKQVEYLLKMLHWYREQILNDFHSLDEKYQHISFTAYDEFIMICDSLILSLDGQLKEEHRGTIALNKEIEHAIIERLKWRRKNNTYLTCLQADYEEKKVIALPDDKKRHGRGKECMEKLIDLLAVSDGENDED